MLPPLFKNIKNAEVCGTTIGKSSSKILKIFPRTPFAIKTKISCLRTPKISF